MATVLLCEAACCYAGRGLTLFDALQELYQKYGYIRESVFSLTLEGREGLARIRNAVSALRAAPPREIGGYAFTDFADYACGVQKNLISGQTQPTGLPASDVLAFTFPAGRIVVRPSGHRAQAQGLSGRRGLRSDGCPIPAGMRSAPKFWRCSTASAAERTACTNALPACSSRIPKNSKNRY